MFTIPTTLPPSAECITAYKHRAALKNNPEYIDPNTLEKTVPSNYHAQIIVAESYRVNNNL